MVRRRFLEGRRFKLDLEVEITSALSFSVGELGALIVDGLLYLEDEGLLFPGVTSPAAGDRLIGASIYAAGYARSHDVDGWETTYRRLLAGKGGSRSSKGHKLVHVRLDETISVLAACFAEQRMLLAKLSASSERFKVPPTVTDADHATAEALMAAADAVLKTHEEAVKPVL